MSNEKRPLIQNAQFAEASVYASLGFASTCPGCGGKINVTDEPVCPKCMIMLSVAPGVRLVALATFIMVVIAFGAAVGASLLAVYMLHEWMADGEPSFAFYPVMLVAQFLLFACAFHGILIAIGLIERVRAAVLMYVCMELAGAWGAAAFIIWQVWDNIYFGF